MPQTAEQVVSSPPTNVTPPQDVPTINEAPAPTSKSLSPASHHKALEEPSESHSGESLAHGSSSNTINCDSIPDSSAEALLSSSERSIPHRAVSFPRSLSSPSTSSKAHTHRQVTGPNKEASRNITSEVSPSSAKIPTPKRSLLPPLREDDESRVVQFSPVQPYSQIQPVPPSAVMTRRPRDDTSAGAIATQSHGQERGLRGDDVTYGDVERRGKYFLF